ncbi:MAG: hypothetical protein IJA94_01740 [Bacilli bacterium]|nr:hypothetical protein [Bacilli bacterium]
MEKKNKKTNHLVLNALLIFLWLFLVGGLSYAYFSISFEKNKENTKAKAIAGKLDVDFETSEYISNKNTWLINDEEIFTKSDKTLFTVKRSEQSTVDDIYYNIYIDELNITDNLKHADVKWRLYNEENPTIETQVMAEGNFNEIGDITNIQLNRARIYLPKEETHTYTLYMWFSNDENENQLDLLNGTLSCKIKLLAITE